MPQVIPIIVSAGLTAAGYTAVTVAAWTLVTTAAVGLYERDKAKRAERRARNAYNASLQDRVITVRSAISARRYVLGTARVGGTLLHAETCGPNKTYLDSVVALAANKCELVGYYIGEEYIAATDFPGDKFGRAEVRDAAETFDVTGPSAVVNLTWPARLQSEVRVSWRAGGATGAAAATIGAGTQINVTGLPAGPATIEVAYTYAISDKLRVQFKDGDPAQTVTNWQDRHFEPIGGPGGPGGGPYIPVFTDIATPNWTSEHRLRGVTHLRTLMVWDENIYPNGAPHCGAVARGGWVDGHPFYDPRTQTNPTYTDNPAVLWAWHRTLPRHLGGMGVPADWIDWDYVTIAANICDELITVRNLAGDGYEQIKRYQCHTVISSDSPPMENEAIILSAMAGKVAFTGNGKYRVIAGAFRTATLTITDAHVVVTKPISCSTAIGDDAPPNIVTATYAGATQNWTETSPKPVRNASYIAGDGHESPLDIRLPATTDPRQANYLMGVALELARPSFSLTLTVGGIGEDIALLDTVRVNLTNRSSYAGRTFEVVRIVEDWSTGEFELSLNEIKATSYALDADQFTPSHPPSLPDLSYLWNVHPISGFTADIGTPQTLPDGNSVTQINLSWDAVAQDYVRQGGRIEIRFRESGGEWGGIITVPGDATSTTLSASLVDGSFYQFQIRAINGLGASSQWVSYWVEVEGAELAVGVAGPGIFTWANPIGVSTTSSTITKTAGAAAYNAGAHSLQSYTGGSFVSARCGQIGTRRVIGLNGDPAVDAGMLGIDYALATTQANVLQVYESGLLVSSHGAVTVDTTIAVKYDNDSVTYEKDGAVIRSASIGAGRRFFLDCSLFEIGATLVDIAFGPMGGRGSQGLPGVAAQSVRLSATSQAFTFNSAGVATPAGQSITFTATRQNIATAAVWSAVASDGLAVTLTGSGDTRALTAANFGTRTWIRVRAESSGFADEITVVRLVQGANGANAIQAFLTNQNHTLAANPEGVVGSYANANGQLFVFDGTVDVTATATLSIQSQTDCTVQLNTAANTPVSGQPKGFYRVTAITADQASAVLRAVYGSVTRDLPLTLTRARQGQPGDGQNLLPVGDWVVGTSGSQGPNNRWTQFGTAPESVIVLGGAGTAPAGPFGTSEVLWECRPGGDGQADGGWLTDFAIDHRRTYRSTVWFRVNQLTGYFYHGCSEANTSNVSGGGANNNPYFASVYLPNSEPWLQANKWYLSVGIVHGSSYTGGYSGVAGIYDPETGRRISQGTEYRNTSGASLQRHRAFHWGDTNTAARQWMPKPRFEEINGSEPTIDSLLGFQRSTPWIETGNCYASTTSFYKVGGSSQWGTDAVHSAASYRTFHLQFKAGSTAHHFMVGANSDPAADANYASIDRTWYCNAGGALQIYESGLLVGDFGTYTPDTDLGIAGDGANIRYYKDRQMLRGPIAAPAVPYGLDSAFYSPGAQANNVKFGPGTEFESISTGELAPSAATEVYTSKAKVSGAIVTTNTSSDPAVFDSGIVRVSFAYTPIVNCLASLTWSAIVRLLANVAGTPGLFYRIGCSDLTTGAFTQEYGSILGVPDGTLEVQFTSVASFPMLAGRQYYFSCTWTKAPGSGGQGVSTNSEVLRTEIIKA